MKNWFAWVSSFTLALTVLPQTSPQAMTNGVIVISTRTASDAHFRQISSSSLYDADDYKGPGAFTPGDAAMAILLQDYGYVTRLVPEWLLRPDATDPTGMYSDLSPGYYYGGGGGPTRPTDTNYLFSAALVIISGSGASADMPPPNTRNIPIIMGEHSCLGDQLLAGESSLYLYANKTSGNQTGSTTGPGQYMIVVAPNHPIMQGIPLDADGRVKIWRDPYPEENAHLPPPEAAPKTQYKYSWTWVNIATSTVAPGTTVIGLEGDNPDRAVFAVNPAGGQLSNGDTNHNNYVHFYVNEHGSSDSRRAFNALTDLGRVIFVRTCKWAMGETLAPYQPLGLIRVSQPAAQRMRLEWNGTADKNYKILGTRKLSNPPESSPWQTVAADIAGTNGAVSVEFDLSGSVAAAFLRVMPVP